MKEKKIIKNSIVKKEKCAFTIEIAPKLLSSYSIDCVDSSNTNNNDPESFRFF
jgi:hypothetical protein